MTRAHTPDLIYRFTFAGQNQYAKLPSPRSPLTCKARKVLFTRHIHALLSPTGKSRTSAPSPTLFHGSSSSPDKRRWYPFFSIFTFPSDLNTRQNKNHIHTSTFDPALSHPPIAYVHARKKQQKEKHCCIGTRRSTIHVLLSPAGLRGPSPWDLPPLPRRRRRPRPSGVRSRLSPPRSDFRPPLRLGRRGRFRGQCAPGVESRGPLCRRRRRRRWRTMLGLCWKW